MENPFISTLPPIPTYPDLRRKVVLITGIGQVGTPGLAIWGNGAATACAFARQGCKIFGCDLNLEAADNTKARIIQEMTAMGFNKASMEISVIKCDVTEEKEVKDMVDKCIETYGRIDVLIKYTPKPPLPFNADTKTSNVGLSMPGTAASMTPDIWAQQLNVNLTTVYNCCHHILPIMESQKSGAIVNIASIAAQRYIGKPQIGYSASKAGVIQFTKATAAMYADKGIRVNVVVPGLMHTPLVGGIG